ncbi:MAG: hypothetical protein ACI957_001101 [Verrucomicrobiales bacterium]|jgi:hypothetical protein
MGAFALLGCYVIASASPVLGQETVKPTLDPIPEPTIESDARGRMTVKLADSGTSFWTVERSFDLQIWEPIKTVRAKNGAMSYLHSGTRVSPNLYYRVVNANTADRLLVSEIVPSYRHWIPHYFGTRERVVFVTPASSGGGGWAGNAGVIQDIVRFEEPINIEEIPFFEDRIRDHRTFVGRVLFYDKRLSADNSKSCASCHRQKNAFADNKALSDGIYGQKTLRNSMRLANLAFTSAKNRTVAKESSSWTFVRPR